MVHITPVIPNVTLCVHCQSVTIKLHILNFELSVFMKFGITWVVNLSSCMWTLILPDPSDLQTPVTSTNDGLLMFSEVLIFAWSQRPWWWRSSTSDNRPVKSQHIYHQYKLLPSMHTDDWRCTSRPLEDKGIQSQHCHVNMHRTPLVYFSASLMTEANVEVLHLSCAQVITV